MKLLILARFMRCVATTFGRNLNPILILFTGKWLANSHHIKFHEILSRFDSLLYCVEIHSLFCFFSSIPLKCNRKLLARSCKRNGIFTKCTQTFWKWKSMSYLKYAFVGYFSISLAFCWNPVGKRTFWSEMVFSPVVAANREKIALWIWHETDVMPGFN